MPRPRKKPDTDKKEPMPIAVKDISIEYDGGNAIWKGLAGWPEVSRFVWASIPDARDGRKLIVKVAIYEEEVSPGGGSQNG